MTEADAVLTAASPQGTNPRGRFFANQTFHFETLRGAGYAQSGSAELGEVFETVSHINEGDIQGWYAAWSATADRVLALANNTRDPLSRGSAYMRAANYQRTGEFLLPPDDSKREESWAKTLAYFHDGLDALGIRYEYFDVPYGSGSLRALYLPGPEGADSKPLFMVVGGFDSILEELYPVFGKAANDRGYAVLLYEGPGQGQALRKYGLTYTAEWEKPNSAVLEQYLQTHEKPAAVVLVGMSMGGYFAPRAAAFEDRIDGVVAFDTCFDFTEPAIPLLEAARNPAAATNPDISWAYHNAMWTMGANNLDETITACAPYRLAPIADRIRQDVLILAGTEDHFIPFHQTEDFANALVNARSVTTRIFDRASGGAQHCQAGCLTLVHAAVFDWLLEKFAPAVITL
jgi:pimeloyl-ACP methyl ester carboxylesterase